LEVNTLKKQQQQQKIKIRKAQPYSFRWVLQDFSSVQLCWCDGQSCSFDTSPAVW